ncbi:MAG: DUF2125 domain-containing protein [Alphaproteobacteria bacterium]
MVLSHHISLYNRAMLHRLRRRAPLVVFLVLLAVSASYATYWFTAARSVEDGIAAWIEARRKEGYTVERRDLEIGGFPFRLTAEVTGVAIGRANGSMRQRWQTERLVAAARPWDLDHIVVTLPPEQRYAERRDDGDERTVTVRTGRGSAAIRLRRGAIARLDLFASDVAVVAPEGDLAAARIAARGARTENGGLDVSFAIDDLKLPPRFDRGLGRDLAELKAEAKIAAPLPSGADAAALAAWSKAGGAIEVTALHLRWGDLALNGDGTLALDDQLRPLAAMSVTIRGYGSVLRMLADEGRMDANDASFATTMLNLMARHNAAGAKVLRVPLTAQNGTLYLGPLALFRLSPVVAR